MAKVKVNLKLFQQRWLHSYEEDTAGGQVYRPESWDFPLSRRPREAIELHSDGRARIFLPGENDRLRPVNAVWSDEEGRIVVRSAGRGGGDQTARRIISTAPDKLVIQS